MYLYLFFSGIGMILLGLILIYFSDNFTRWLRMPEIQIRDKKYKEWNYNRNILHSYRPTISKFYGKEKARIFVKKQL